MFFYKIIQSPCCLFLKQYRCAFHSVFFDDAKLRKKIRSCKSFPNKSPRFSQLLKSNLRSRQSAETSTLVLGVSEGEMTGVIWERRGRDDRRDENGKIPLFKGLGTIRLERWTDFANTPSLSVNNASLISNNPALFALNPILFCARCSLTGNYLFPPWEQNIPSLGIKHSHRGNIVRTIKSSSFSCLSYLQQIVIEYLLGFGLLSLHIFKRQRPNMNRHFAKL